jgi:hypothetical protein
MSSDESLQTLQSMFPSMDVEICRIALENNNNDVAAAIEMLLQLSSDDSSSSAEPGHLSVLSTGTRQVTDKNANCRTELINGHIVYNDAD